METNDKTYIHVTMVSRLVFQMFYILVLPASFSQTFVV